MTSDDGMLAQPYDYVHGYQTGSSGLKSRRVPSARSFKHWSGVFFEKVERINLQITTIMYAHRL